MGTTCARVHLHLTTRVAHSVAWPLLARIRLLSSSNSRAWMVCYWCRPPRRFGETWRRWRISLFWMKSGILHSLAQFSASLVVVRNVEEAENIESLVSLTVFQFLFWFPSVKWQIRDRQGKEKKSFPQFGDGKGMKKKHPHNSGTGRESKKAFPKSETGLGIKKLIPMIRELESGAFILGNGRERDIPVTPDWELGPHSSSQNRYTKWDIR